MQDEYEMSRIPTLTVTPNLSLTAAIPSLTVPSPSLTAPIEPLTAPNLPLSAQIQLSTSMWNPSFSAGMNPPNSSLDANSASSSFFVNLNQWCDDVDRMIQEDRRMCESLECAHGSPLNQNWTKTCGPGFQQYTPHSAQLQQYNVS